MAERIERDAIYSSDDVARIMGLKPAAIRRWIREGRLPASKLGKRYWVRGADPLRLVPEQLGEKQDIE